MTGIQVGAQTCTTLAEGARREWLVADGLGGYAMGTVAGLRTRRYHGLLVVATAPRGAGVSLWPRSTRCSSSVTPASGLVCTAGPTAPWPRPASSTSQRSP